MLNRFFPGEMADSVYDLPYEQFYLNGMRGIIFDIDNTLVPHGAAADERAVSLFKRLKNIGMATCLLSNNREPRVKSFATQVASKYIYKADKPSIKNYKYAMHLMGTDRKSTLFVGDQLFTDIYGANRSGIYSVLVKPIHPKEEIQIVLKRRLEAVVLWIYRRKKRENTYYKRS